MRTRRYRVRVAAKGRGLGGWVVAATLLMIFLVSTDTWNPFPGIWDWANSSRSLSDPAPDWQQRLGGRPESVTRAGDLLVVDVNGAVEARAVSDGTQRWSRKADWGA